MQVCGVVGARELLREAAPGGSGSAGTTSPAAETDRVEAIMSAASGGTITNSTALEWVSVSNTETSRMSLFGRRAVARSSVSDDLATPRAVTAGDNFTIAIGDLDLAITPIAA